MLKFEENNGQEMGRCESHMFQTPAIEQWLYTFPSLLIRYDMWCQAISLRIVSKRMIVYYEFYFYNDIHLVSESKVQLMRICVEEIC